MWSLRYQTMGEKKPKKYSFQLSLSLCTLRFSNDFSFYTKKKTQTRSKSKSDPIRNTFDFRLFLPSPQSILQHVEHDTPTFLPIVNTQINEIFGPTRSFFVNTTPRKFLFEGVEFCKVSRCYYCSAAIIFLCWVTLLFDRRNFSLHFISNILLPQTFCFCTETGRLSSGHLPASRGSELDVYQQIERWQFAVVLDVQPCKTITSFLR